MSHSTLHVDSDDHLIEELSPRFAELQSTINCLTVVVAIAFCLITHTLLEWVSRHLVFDSGAVFIFRYQPVILWFFPCVGTTLSFDILLAIWSIFKSREVSDAYAQWAA